MFNPPVLKWKKEHKSSFKNKEVSVKNTSLIFGQIGFIAKKKGVVFYKELDAAKKILSKVVKGLGLVILRVKPMRPRTKQKPGMRMGKGKGNVSSWVVPVKAGMVLLEVFGLVDLKAIKKVFKATMLRLSVKVKVVIVPSGRI